MRHHGEVIVSLGFFLSPRGGGGDSFFRAEEMCGGKVPLEGDAKDPPRLNTKFATEGSTGGTIILY